MMARDTYNLGKRRPSDRQVEELAEALGRAHPMLLPPSQESSLLERQWDTDSFAVALAIGDSEGRLRRKALQVAGAVLEDLKAGGGEL